MPMNVKPIATLEPRINEIRELTARIVNREILPHERELAAGWRHGATAEEKALAKERTDAIKDTVKRTGLWAPRDAGDRSTAYSAGIRHSSSTGAGG